MMMLMNVKRGAVSGREEELTGQTSVLFHQNVLLLRGVQDGGGDGEMHRDL
jgi:hypothetical protein